MPFKYLDSILEGGQVRIPYDSARGRLFLSEKDLNSDISKLEITGFDSDCIAFRLEGLKKPRKTHLYLKNSADNIHKGCDGVLVFRINGNGYILICELKSKNGSGYEKQFHSSQAFVDYLCSITKRFYNVDMSGFKRRNILFTTRAFANKKPFRPYKGPLGNEYLSKFFCNPNKRDIPSYDVKCLLGFD